MDLYIRQTKKTNEFVKIENKKKIMIHNNNGLSKEDANMWNNRKMGIDAQEELNKQLRSENHKTFYEEKKNGIVYKLKIGDVLPNEVINAWAKQDNNYCSLSNENIWININSNFADDRHIKGFNMINGHICFLVSNTNQIYLKAKGFKEFMENYITNSKNKSKIYNLRKEFKKDFVRLLKKYQEHETLEKEFNIVNKGDRLTLMEEVEIIMNTINKYDTVNENKFKNTQDIITDKAIDLVWGNAEFGKNETKRELIAKSLLKIASDYEIGSTIKQIMENLGLVKTHHKGLTESNTKLTLLGKEFLYRAYEK
jgi:hypothetical protein